MELYNCCCFFSDKLIFKKKKKMYSRFVFRSIQSSTPSVIFNRCLSLTQAQLAAATKLKEKPTTSDKSAEKTDKSSTPTAATAKSTNTTLEEKKTIPPPSSGLNDPNKTYSEKIQRLVDEISKLSLVDVMDLNELLKVKFNEKKTNKHQFKFILFLFFLENIKNSRCTNNGIWRCC